MTNSIDIPESTALSKYETSLAVFMDIINDLMLDRDLREIATKRKVGISSVRAIQADFAQEIGSYEDRTIQRLQRAISLGTHQLCESIEMRAIDPEKIPAALGVLIDKRELLAGKPTTRSQTMGDQVVDIDSLNRIVAEIQDVEVGESNLGLNGPPLLPE
jgi:hypothetical protein